ncbi:hypothetical protein TNCV_4024641 [Trichonephila clavipes]|uniref:Uncharacterized protein n=1 Tax=Trichonephila clavipes TaxID=2585209 RepID=A0A8X6WDI8_TRICX|nr:hypothetical protein TNCV_4024641 [Trichonephila clavipes]
MQIKSDYIIIGKVTRRRQEPVVLIAIVQGINRVILKKDQGERHTSIGNNRRPLVRPSSGFWTELNRRIKKCRKDTLAFKRFWLSGSGGAERTYIKGPRQQEAKRKLTSVKSNDLTYIRKRCRRDETLMPSNSGYNLQSRNCAKEESRPSSEKMTQQGGPVRSRGNREPQYSPLRRGAKEVRWLEYQKQKTSAIAFLGEDRRSDQSKIPIPRGASRRPELAERWTELPQVSDESRSFFRVHTGYFSNIPKCIKAEFVASWACSQSSVVSSSKR